MKKIKILVLSIILMLTLYIGYTNNVKADFMEYPEIFDGADMPVGWSGTYHNFELITSCLEDYEISMIFQYNEIYNTSYKVWYIDIIEWGTYEPIRIFTDTSTHETGSFYADPNALEDDEFIYFIDTITYTDGTSFSGFDTVSVHLYDNELY